MSRYTVNDVEFPSVTECLGLLDKSSALMYWAVNCAIKYIEKNINNPIYLNNIAVLLSEAKTKFREVSQDSLDIGSEVHSSIEAYIKFGKDKIGTIRPEVASALVAFWSWEKENKVKWLESEQNIVNENVGYGGTLDAIAEVNGIITCIDFKSSKGIYDEYFTQVVAYKYARESMAGKYKIKSFTGEYIQEFQPMKIEAVGILRLDKETGIPEWKMYNKKEEIEREYQAFCALVNYFYLAKNRRLKNNPFAK